MEKKVILISEQDLKDNSNIELNNDTKILSLSILDTQKLYLKPILGNSLFEEVIDSVYQSATNDGFVISNKIKNLLEVIRPYLIHAVIVDYLITNNYKLTNKGVLKLNDTSASNVSPSELEYAKNYYDSKMTAYKAALIGYLKDNNLTTRKADKDITTDVIGWYLPGLNQCN